MLFEPARTYKFRHIVNAALVRDRTDLKNKIEKFGFPPGRLLTPRDRQWTGKELNDYFESRPSTQTELKAALSNHEPSKPVISKPAKAKRKAKQ